jgi:hypothetical protein
LDAARATEKAKSLEAEIIADSVEGRWLAELYRRSTGTTLGRLKSNALELQSMLDVPILAAVRSKKGG